MERKITENIIDCTKELRKGNRQMYLENLHKVWAYFNSQETKLKDKPKIINNIIQEKTQEVKLIKEEPKIVKLKFNSLDELTKINGIGKKTVDDIKKQASTINELIELIKFHKLALRDDIETKLAKELL